MIIHKMSADERAKEVSRRRERRLHDEADALSFARDEGEAIGIKKGQNDVIRKMRMSGMTEEQINHILSYK